MALYRMVAMAGGGARRRPAGSDGGERRGRAPRRRAAAAPAVPARRRAVKKAKYGLAQSLYAYTKYKWRLRLHILASSRKKERRRNLQPGRERFSDFCVFPLLGPEFPTLQQLRKLYRYWLKPTSIDASPWPNVSTLANVTAEASSHTKEQCLSITLLSSITLLLYTCIHQRDRQQLVDARVITMTSSSCSGVRPYLMRVPAVGNPTECETFNGDVYGRGVYVSPGCIVFITSNTSSLDQKKNVSPHQQYAKLYSRRSPRQVGAHGKVRLVFGLRLHNPSAISRTSDSRIWLIKNPADVVVQDINLTFD
jgi:hypothetical protein